MKQFYSVSEVAARFEVTSQSVRNWIAAGQLLSVQATPGGRYKIPGQALIAFEQKSGVPPSDPAMATLRLGEPIASELCSGRAPAATSGPTLTSTWPFSRRMGSRDVVSRCEPTRVSRQWPIGQSRSTSSC